MQIRLKFSIILNIFQLFNNNVIFFGRNVTEEPFSTESFIYTYI